MNHARRILAVAAVSAISGVFAMPAHAAGAADEAAGLALFEDGKRLAASKQWEQACPKFAEANRLYPRAGILLVLGDCYEHASHLASAWGAFKSAEVVARNANDPTREQEAARRAQALEPGLSKLTIVAPPNPPSGLTVLWDSATVGEGRWGSPTPVDAGLHRVEVTAPGWQPWSTTVQIPLSPGNTDLRIPQMTAASGARGADSANNLHRTLGMVVAGSGVAGFVVGSVFGAVAISKSSASKANCSPTDPNLCSAAGVSARNDEKSAGTASTVGLVAGGVLLAGGAILLWTAPSSRPTDAVQVGLVPEATGSDLGLSIMGRW